MNEDTGVYDFSKIISEFDEGKDVPQNGKWAPRHFFRGGMIGPSGCGKTSCLLSMIISPTQDTRVGFDKIYIYAKDIHEPAYEMLKKILRQTEEEIRRIEKKESDWCLFVMSDNLKEVPEVKDLKKGQRNLMIFDDWATDSAKDQNIIQQHYKMGRKHHCSYLYLSQSYYDIPAFIRKQFTHLFVWRLRNNRDITRVLSEHNPGFDDEIYKEMYMHATEPKYSFCIIDKMNPELPFRMGFKNIPQFE